MNSKSPEDKRAIYPPLPTGVDALRILQLQPGDFYDPLTCTSVSHTFGDKPKYVALSYTWERPYVDISSLPTSPDEDISQNSSLGGQQLSTKMFSSDYSPNEVSTQRNPKLPSGRHPQIALATSRAITVNEQRLRIHHNLYLALLHLRSPNEPLSIWIDAICISQEDIQERNSQVALMPFIYTRARTVIAWLGTKAYTKQLEPFRALSLDWMTGQTKVYPDSLADQARMMYSPEPDLYTFSRIMDSTYWGRLWIVQEVCLAPKLVFVYGSKIWRYDDIEQWECMAQARMKRCQQSSNDTQESKKIELAKMLRLLDIRKRKHASDMKLENLIELFATNACTDIKDKIYGLLGLAKDVVPSADPPTDSMKSHIDLHDSLEDPPGSLRTIRVDYERSTYEIWTDVVGFIYNSPRPRDKQQSRRRDEDLAVSGSLHAPERCVTIVRTAGLVQEALRKEQEEDITGGPGPEVGIVAVETSKLLTLVIHSLPTKAPCSESLATWPDECCSLAPTTTLWFPLSEQDESGLIAGLARTTNQKTWKH